MGRTEAGAGEAAALAEVKEEARKQAKQGESEEQHIKNADGIINY